MTLAKPLIICAHCWGEIRYDAEMHDWRHRETNSVICDAVQVRSSSGE